MKNFVNLWLLVSILAITGFSSVYAQAGSALQIQGVFDNQRCIQCHQLTERKLVDDWRNSIHAKSRPVIDCVSCHGDEHDKEKLNARRDSTCTECHGGEQGPVVHSYSSSKHGALMRIESNQQNWTKPLSMASYRMPGCGYCHMHSGSHDVSASVRTNSVEATSSEAAQDYVRAVCQDCHSPRYITRLLENGNAMLEIARKKVREADALIKQASSVFTGEELTQVRMQRVKMQQHLINVYLGVGHQSPDYQWWHGQPALDGDLLRIKGAISDLRREISYRKVSQCV